MSAHLLDITADESSDFTQISDFSKAETNIHRWERVGSAVLGGALLTLGLGRRSLDGTVIALVGGWLSYRAISGHSRLYQALGLNTAAGRDQHEPGVPADSLTVEQSITIGKPADELSEFLRDSENLGRIMGHFAEVTSAGEDRHHWIVRGPLGRSLSWETRIVEDHPGEFLRWESVNGASLANEWSVYFRPAPGDRGTEVTLQVRFDPPGGALGSAAMKQLNIVPGTLVSTALHRFKSLVETGGTPTLERNPSARGKGDLI